MELHEVKVSYRNKTKVADRIKITSSQDAQAYLREAWEDNMELHESFYVLFLNRANHVLGHYKLSLGGGSGTVVDIRLLFAYALKTLAHAIIVAHNHPSGNLKPSKNDQELTKKIAGAGELLDINVLDHLILTTEEMYSFADEGMMPG